MQKQTTLLFGIHMHQPVDNFKEVITHAVNVCYRPFFQVASRYPQFKFSVHCSGWLMQQIQQDHPELFKLIKELYEQGSIEFFSAGFYEPILSSIPSADRITQIEMLNEALQEQFSHESRGLWLTERVWESSLIPDLCKSGIKYSVIDDYHFQCAGFDEEVLDGYYMTEEGGQSMGIFPISKKLRYALPFSSVESAVKAIKSFNRKKNSAAIIFDDAEKFGMWPGTYSWVYEKKWLQNFIEAIIADKSITCEHYGSYFDTHKPRGIAYLPNVSYYEMGEWSLKASDTLRLEALKAEMGEDRYNKEGVKFLKGGIWKNFFVKYEESNRIHKRMLELSQAREALKSELYNENLYKLQTNDALWHGVFGGLYLPNLRDNAYSYLIACENIRYANENLIITDNSEMDGYEKIKTVTPLAIFRFDSKTGGQLIEFDSKEDAFNWQNTLTRREEAYHATMIKAVSQDNEREKEPFLDGIDTIHNSAHHVDEEIQEALVYDWYLKNSFIDHISDKSLTLENFTRCSFKEYGDFANQPFFSSVTKEQISFERKGGIFLPQEHPATLRKSYTPTSHGFEFNIELTTDFSYFFNYMLELNLHFAEYDKVTINGHSPLQAKSHEQLKSVEIVDGYLKKKIRLSLNKEFELLYYPLKTVSQSEQGFDLTLQGVGIALVFPFSKTLCVSGSLEVSHV